MTTPTPATDLASTSLLQRPFVIGVVAAIVCALPALALNRWEVSLAEDRRLVPAVLYLRSATMVLPLLALVVVIGFVARRAWPAVRALPKPRRFAWIAGLAAMQLTLLCASAYAHIVTQKNWLFSTPLPFASVSSPDGQRTAYATQQCFLGCNVEVHVRDGSSLTMRRVHTYPHSRGEHARMVWVGDAPEVQGLTPSPSLGSFGGGWH
jgi:hypothetical protein